MNWGLVGWVAGTMLTIYMIKFVISLMRSVFSKENANRVISGIGNSCDRAGERCTEYLRYKVENRRRKKEPEPLTPTVHIR